MNTKSHLLELERLLLKRNDLEICDFELQDASSDNTSFNFVIDDTLLTTLNEIGKIKINWLLDFEQTTISTLDSGIDIVGGVCNIDTVNVIFDKSRSEKLLTSRFFQKNEELMARKESFYVIDNCTPNYLSLVQNINNVISDNIFFVHSSFNTKIFDLNMPLNQYISIGAQTAFIYDWQIALLKEKTHNTAILKHYMPALFPELRNSDFTKSLD